MEPEKRPDHVLVIHKSRVECPALFGAIKYHQPQVELEATKT
jgi:hypothetical protein